MFDKDTLIALQESQAIVSAASCIANSALAKDLAALPSDYKISDLEPYLPNRRRARGVMSTNSLDSFASYTKAHAEPGASVFVEQETMSATSVLNLGNPATPGHADNRAKLQLKRTAAFSALVGIATGTGHKQTTVAEFLEDWPDMVSCFNEAGPITNTKAIAAVRKLTIESMRKLERSEQSLSTTRSAFESVQATSVDPIPTTLVFRCVPYNDLAERAIAIRVSILTGNDKPTVALRIITPDTHNEQMAQELADLITLAFEDSEIDPLPVLLGSYSKS